MRPARSTFAVLVALLAVTPARAEEVRESHHLLGAIVEIVVTASDRETGQYWSDQAAEVGRRLERELRTDDERSEIGKLAQHAGEGPVRVPLDVYRVIAIAQLLARVTGGAFDPTIGPLLKARRLATQHGTAAGSDAIDAALGFVGYDRVSLHPPDRVELMRAGMVIELGAVGRGYVASRMAARLRQLGVTRGLVHFGDGIHVAIGPPDGEPAFSIPVPRGDGIAGTIALRDRALAITHSLRRDDDGADGGSQPHMIDPRSGRFVESSRQAAVIALDAAIAAGWSTAMVVDPDGVAALLETPRDVEAIGFDEHGEHRTSRFVAAASWRPATEAEKSARPADGDDGAIDPADPAQPSVVTPPNEKHGESSGRPGNETSGAKTDAAGESRSGAKTDAAAEPSSRATGDAAAEPSSAAKADAPRKGLEVPLEGPASAPAAAPPADAADAAGHAQNEDAAAPSERGSTPP